MFGLPSLPSSPSGTAAQYPHSSSSDGAVGIKLRAKKRWSVKRVLLILLTAVAGYDFCNEFSLGAGSKGPPVKIAAKQQQQRDSATSSWRERSLALLRIKSTRKAPPPPPQPPAARPTSPPLTALNAAPAPSSRCSSASVYCNSLTNDDTTSDQQQPSPHFAAARTWATAMQEQESKQHDEYNENAAEEFKDTDRYWTQRHDNEFADSQLGYGVGQLHSPSSQTSASPHSFSHTARSPRRLPWQSAEAFTQLVEA